MYQGLNHSYRLIWSQFQHCWVAVGELAKSRGKQGGKLSSTSKPQTKNRLGINRLSWIIALLSLSPGLAIAGPELAGVQQGVGNVSQQGNTTTINQRSQRLGLNWHSFNIDAHETVNFVQPGRDSLAINHILDTNGSQIHGRLNANGQVWLVNPNGVLFGKQAQVNVGGIVASSLAMVGANSSAAQFRKGQVSGLVQNLGNIQTAEGGYIAFIGEQVSNHGQLNSSGGDISLAAGSKVNLSFAGSQLLSLDIAQSTLNNLADNQGLIQAEGGRVLMNAGARDSLLASVVNNDGVIEAHSVVERNGEIILLAGMSAGTTTVNGRLDASASIEQAGGGFIETSGHQVHIGANSHISTAAAAGNGLWLIDPNDFTIAASGGDISGATLSSQLANNNVEIQSINGSNSSGNGDIFVNDSVSWAANNTLTLNAQRHIEINQSISASGASGKLILHYGQGNLAAGNTAEYHVNAPINLQAGQNFSIQLGSDGSQINYTVITELGAEGSTTGTDLQGMQGDLAGHYALGADIDAAVTSTWESGKGFKPIGDSGGTFSGSLNGQGHTINKLSILRASNNNIGLIGYSGTTTSIRNISLTEVNIKGAINVGGLIGSSAGTVRHSYTTGTVDGSESVGGLIGYSNNTVRSSNSASIVTGRRILGGLIGFCEGGAVFNSYATGSVTGSGDYIGGLAGNTYLGTTISNSYATGAVAGDDEVGGLIGLNRGPVSNSYSSSTVNGDDMTGGLIGRNFNAVSNTYASGAVTGDDQVGGLIGESFNTVSNSYASGAVSGRINVGGLIGDSHSSVNTSYWDKNTSGQSSSSGSANSFGKTSAEMQEQATFSGWDIDDTGGSGKVWRIYAGHTAPLLRNFLRLASANNLSTQSTYNGQAQQYNLANHLFSAASSSAASYTNAGNYNINAADLWSHQQGYDILSNNNATFQILAKTITFSASRDYDGTIGLNTSLLGTTGLIGSDQLNVSGSTTLASKNAGSQTINTGSLILGNGNYVLASSGHTATISAKAIQLSASRAYDGTTGLSLSLLTPAGLIGSDQLNVSGSATLANKNVGSQTINTGSLNLGNGNYVLANTGHAATINAKEILLSASRVYDGTTGLSLSLLTPAGLIGSDQLNVSGSSTLASKNAGSQTINTGSLTLGNGNYVLASSGHTATINAKPIQLNASRDYDGSTILNINLLNSTGLIGEDQLGLSGNATLASKNVGTQTINTSNLNLGNGNYLLSGLHIALIEPRLVTIVINAEDKVFDNTTGAVVNFAGSTGIVAGDQANLAYSTAQFSQVLGNNLPVSVQGITLFGQDAANYILSADALTTTASITRTINTDSTLQALANEAGPPPTAELASLNNGGAGFDGLPATAAGGKRCGNFVAQSVDDESTENWADALDIELLQEKLNDRCDDYDYDEDEEDENV